MRGGILHTFFVAAACLLLVCCTRPAYYEEFVRADEAESGIYSFTLDLSDSLSTYDLSFYLSPVPMTSKLDSTRAGRCMPVYIVWTGPDEGRFEEMVYMDPNKEVQPYREAVSMTAPGEWNLELRPMEVPTGFRGIGVICHRNDN